MKTSKMLRTSPYLIVESMKSKRVQQTRTQLLDTAQANRMQTTARHLGLFDTPLLKDGDTLPPVYHMAYFTPLAAEHELGPDGAERTFNPGEPFTRRMWSGGSMIWNQENPLRLGQEVEEVTTLEKVESKQTRDRKSMIVVTGKKEYTNHGGLCLTDSRKWLFLEPSDAMIVRRQTQPAEVLKGSKLGSVRTTEITLFRYSALTFNSHKIHFDREWCNKIEKHPEIVVHGPLNSQ